MAKPQTYSASSAPHQVYLSMDLKEMAQQITTSATMIGRKMERGGRKGQATATRMCAPARGTNEFILVMRRSSLEALRKMFFILATESSFDAIQRLLSGHDLLWGKTGLYNKHYFNTSDVWTEQDRKKVRYRRDEFQPFSIRLDQGPCGAQDSL